MPLRSCPFGASWLVPALAPAGGGEHEAEREIAWRRGGTHVGRNVGGTDLWVVAVEPT